MTMPSNFQTLIESDTFPFEFLSILGEQESWRKEIHRPIYHIHKWWAKRLGSTFRGILLSCVLPQDADLKQEFYKRHDFTNCTVLDPFMGSGTTIGEAHKLGISALGRDINPIASESVRVGLGKLDRTLLLKEFARLERTVGSRLRDLYRTTDRDGNPADVLYYFWVKNVPCGECGAAVDLFSTYVFAKNAYSRKRPAVHVLCPHCDAVFASTFDERRLTCPECVRDFDPHSGTTTGSTATCRTCHTQFRILDVVKETDRPPKHRLYAKLVLTASGDKQYLRVTQADRDAYDSACSVLREEERRAQIRLPDMTLADGYNTRQALNYNYRAWRDFFNDRQLLALAWLQREIANIENVPTRDAFFTLFSGVLEFNNLFASYKGEGTGAVRHMFAHHILKPERTPIEANPWGTPRSSGSFSTLFRSRLLRAIEYRISPMEIGSDGNGKETSSRPFSGIVEDWPTTLSLPAKPRAIYLSCGSSDDLRIPNQSIDFVVTDPPFFDNVHYSELADFFYAWQVLYPHGFVATNGTSTRHPREVQDANASAFASKLSRVLAECRRVLKDDGLLVFTYHHSRAEGWEALAGALAAAGLDVVNAQPVKSEMSVAMPKMQAREPIQIDVVLVCRKQLTSVHTRPDNIDTLHVLARTSAKVARLRAAKIIASAGDRLVIAFSELLCCLRGLDEAGAIDAVRRHAVELENASRIAESDHLLGRTQTAPPNQHATP